MISLSRILVVCVAIAIGLVAGASLASGGSGTPPPVASVGPTERVAEQGTRSVESRVSNGVPPSVQAPIRSIPLPVLGPERNVKPPGRMVLAPTPDPHQRLIENVANLTGESEATVAALVRPAIEESLHQATREANERWSTALSAYGDLTSELAAPRFKEGSGGYEEIVVVDAAGRETGDRLLAQYRAAGDHVSTRVTSNSQNVLVRRIVRTPTGEYPELDRAREAFERTKSDAKARLIQILRQQ